MAAEDRTLEILEAAERLGQLVAEKNLAYGDSVTASNAIMLELYPGGIQPEQYMDALLVIRIVDKLKRISNAKGAFDEDPFMDIAGYGLRGMVGRGRFG